MSDYELRFYITISKKGGLNMSNNEIIEKIIEILKKEGRTINEASRILRLVLKSVGESPIN